MYKDMKAIFIAYNQAYGTEIVELLSEHGQRGFTQWVDIQGRGGLTMVPDEKAPELMAALKETDRKYPDLGLRAFQWTLDEGSEESGRI